MNSSSDANPVIDDFKSITSGLKMDPDTRRTRQSVEIPHSSFSKEKTLHATDTASKFSQPSSDESAQNIISSHARNSSKSATHHKTTSEAGDEALPAVLATSGLLSGRRQPSIDETNAIKSQFAGNIPARMHLNDVVHDALLNCYAAPTAPAHVTVFPSNPVSVSVHDIPDSNNVPKVFTQIMPDDNKRSASSHNRSEIRKKYIRKLGSVSANFGSRVDL